MSKRNWKRVSARRIDADREGEGRRSHRRGERTAAEGRRTRATAECRNRGAAPGIVLLVLSLVAAGCSLLPTEETGTLILTPAPQLRARTIEPDLEMEVSYYDVYGSGPDGAEFEQLGIFTTTVVQASLLPGDWTIRVEAYNADAPPAMIGLGEKTVTVAAGEVLSVTVAVTPLSGTGTLSVEVTWPEGVLASSTLSVSLVPAGEAYDPSVHDIEPAISGTTAVVEQSGLEAGYHTLSLALRDAGERVWGTVAAVRILADETSYRLYELEEDVNRGGVSLTIVEQLDNPIDITFDVSDGAEIQAGDTLTVTAETSRPVDSYEWYLQGSLEDGISNTISVEPSGTGYYRLDLLVTDGSVLSSATLQFRVVERSAGAEDVFVYSLVFAEPGSGGEPDTMTAGGAVLDRELIDLTQYSTIDDFLTAGVPYQEIVAASIDDATFEVNDTPLTILPEQPGTYYAQIDVVNPGEAVSLLVLHNDTEIAETVTMPNRPTITSDSDAPVTTFFSSALDTELTIRPVDIEWNVDAPLPAEFDIQYSISIEYTRDTSSGGHTTGAEIRNIDASARSARVEPTSEEIEFVAGNVYTNIDQENLGEYTFSAVTISRITVVAKTTADLGGPSGELPSFLEVRNPSQLAR